MQKYQVMFELGNKDNERLLPRYIRYNASRGFNLFENQRRINFDEIILPKFSAEKREK